ncbi:hypothetical protein COEREDRAFT_81688 [Coemansia reversa NRRL 1564]|uniref:Transforming acidic coiled-coil-containing protein C-terminal domain-containing protein n=1 Tax=Coemansia reversa (strain ATCC 12441 / NRRL 1564) TaxID=763665 RepID=A0A2G5BAG3_COERN|nr:hypothetical protein COEREDRAFT_81688 [Coemansia reversa NRRL 1564]|eukprot:PIA16001.1 hypothetical protein COEREDRAFT_81688 [Coemansia reversa NRRL 1564]
MEDLTKTPASKDSRLLDSDLSLESPPPMLLQSPYVGVEHEQEFQPSVSLKRTRADIATPLRPGSMEARAQEMSEFINTPARAPSAMKRAMRSGSPIGRNDTAGDDDVLRGSTGRLLADRSDPVLDATSTDSLPPKFNLGGDNGLEATPTQPHPLSHGSGTVHMSDEAIFDSAPLTDVHQQSTSFALGVTRSGSDAGEAADAVDSMTIASSSSEHGADSAEDTTMAEEELSGLVTVDSDIEFTAGPATADTHPDQPLADAPESMVVDPDEKAASPDIAAESLHITPDIIVDKVAPEAILDAALAAGASETSLREQTVVSPIAYLPLVRNTSTERAELVTAKILEDSDLMSAAAVPLPATPSIGNQSLTPSNKTDAKGSSDFLIPTDWLMDPSTSRRRGQQTGVPDSPLKQYSSPSGDNGSLIPVTPANQKLLDSLEIQWVTPRQVPKYSEVEMENVRAEYEERIKRENELREKVLQALKEEYATNMRKQEERAEQMLKEVEDMFQAHIEHKEREFVKQLDAEKLKHKGEIARRDEEKRVESAELSREIDNAINERASIVSERDELRTMLDDYVATSSKLLEERETEGIGLTRELGKLTLERQRLQEQLDETLARASILDEEKREALENADSATLEKNRLEQLAEALRNDVMVAEERSSKIKEHAENTLAGANAEIGNVHQQLAASREETVMLKNQALKSDAKARSLQIQLDSMKRQNEELLALCEGLGVPP